jgi:chromosome segregation ATPase
MLKRKLRDVYRSAAKAVTGEDEVESLQERILELRAKIDSLIALDIKKNETIATLRDRAERAELRKRDAESERDRYKELGSKAEQYKLLLIRARELLIHEKVDEQLKGHADNRYERNGYGSKPAGWRVNGIGELIDKLDGELPRG